MCIYVKREANIYIYICIYIYIYTHIYVHIYVCGLDMWREETTTVGPTFSCNGSRQEDRNTEKRDTDDVSPDLFRGGRILSMITTKIWGLEVGNSWRQTGKSENLMRKSLHRKEVEKGETTFDEKMKQAHRAIRV